MPWVVAAAAAAFAEPMKEKAVGVLKNRSVICPYYGCSMQRNTHKICFA